MRDPLAMSTPTWIPPDTFADRLLRTRKARQLTVAQAAERAGVSPATWSTWERGAHPRDLLDVVQRISEGLEVDRDWLVWGTLPADYQPTTGRWPGGDPFDMPVPRRHDLLTEAVAA